MKKFIKGLSLCLGAVLSLTLCLIGYLDYSLPASYYVTHSGEISCGANITASPDGDSEMTLKLFGVIPIKEAGYKITDAPLLIPGGTPVGIKLLTEGVVVVDMTEVEKGICPCREAGLKIGDCIKSANGRAIASADDIQDIITESQGEEIRLSVSRDGKAVALTLKAAYSEKDGCYKAGLWIRDSQAGVGTLTFIDPKTGTYGALGHPVSDYDTGGIMPLRSGELVSAAITSVDKGIKGAPGELHGRFTSERALGDIRINCERGIFGVLDSIPTDGAIPMAFKSEVTAGDATILATVNGREPKEYDIQIEKITLNNLAGTKNMVIRVTDPELLMTTGGIVQGMSGSPIIQKGKLVGAVTHVFVSDPTRGYGIFAENMLEAAYGAEEENAA